MVYDARSLYIFKADWRIRERFVWFKSWPAFDNFILFVIIVNSLFMAAYDYADRDGIYEWNRISEKVEKIFTVIFIIEFLIKIIAMGFVVHRNSYLRDPWNWLDFVVVMTAVFEFLTGGGSDTGITALRALRVLRPLRSINAYPSMKRLIGTLLSSLPRLANVVVFILFIFFLFGILGVKLFQGVLYQRCRLTEEPNPLTGPNALWAFDEERLCSKDGSGLHECPAGYTCGAPHDFGLPKTIDNVKD